MDEIEPQMDPGADEVETKKELAIKSECEVLRDEKGRLIHGHPLAGRPKGLLNKFTQIKKDMLDAWKEADGKERFLSLLKGDKRDFMKAVDQIISIMPKESIVDLEATVGPKVVIVVKGDQDPERVQIIDENNEQG